ncbi:nitrogenase-stabilizing/protective protein NifW [Rhodovulum steppense]|uniref:Nitrogenase-stabilizing/protective protein NifW n=1 Tax=Rhodovulum steppense TaxID=540251 RepID=A0A4R1YW71_9RHOB|nr:nitrogenase-stabilizing/protective protein NifW [Rhodovulum steppense]TCM85217.1 nitrogenase-stabilizing/protective protein [Rhodovulum steppense]
MSCKPDRGVLDQMHALSSAEDLFTFLLLPYDQSVLNRARLHVMKRMGDYLSQVELSALDEDGVFLEARRALKRAHADFQTSTPRAQKALKIFNQPRGNVVPMEGLRLSVQ